MEKHHHYTHSEGNINTACGGNINTASGGNMKKECQSIMEGNNIFKTKDKRGSDIGTLVILSVYNERLVRAPSPLYGRWKPEGEDGMLTWAPC